MNNKLKDYLLNISNFSGANASIKLPVSIDLINIVLQEIDIPKVQSICLKSISNNELEFFIQTKMLMYRNNTIRVKIFPQIKLPGLLVSAEILDGLSKMQMFIIRMFTNNKVEIEGKNVTIQLLSLLPLNLFVIENLTVLKKILIETDADGITFDMKLEID